MARSGNREAQAVIKKKKKKKKKKKRKKGKGLRTRTLERLRSSRASPSRTPRPRRGVQNVAGLNGWLHHLRTDGCVGGGGGGCGPGDCQQQSKTRSGRGGDEVSRCGSSPAAGQTGAVGAAFVLQTGGVQRHPPRRAAAVSEHGRTRRDQPRGGRRRAVPADRGPAGAGPVNGVAGAGQKRRPPPLSGPGRRRRRVPSGPRPKAAKLVLSRGCGRWWRPSWPCGGRPADRRLAAAGLPSGSGDAGVARDHLSVAVHPEPRRAAPGAPALSAHGRAMRYPRGKRLPQGRGQLRDTLHISQRPAEAADRAVPGHWEGDLVFGKRPSAVGTLVERHSRYVLLFPLPDGVTAQQVRQR